ncbi:MAG: plasmid maintenance system killer protein [Deltaproteobacteria bacterium RIFCSPLOWO2_01_44_7]|nr:MAG: plasmid maintenance system killer protein [Deltaproteobacteria bacterium RIFCSPHIGHO2_01_FULL_43_49]OGQ16208.1 MAG: plasmid maintenance system killer protein [Deltaproteobacteria bacterium RIFCSPHIGHO2_02_FULL_44_53]OGQ29168.1 MAG: plasmid maintenance system killer protein [Deltaproteobacteria bacterium RIFCSPHIGHO2_12_FULL_44_21]OGQ32725.1 MAG: plasmid maintenance system killer protein [Deltaproteobacteria bacterium RIFCSPLOWO2_01_FULL_45_74]OGQ41827.1 MAG: plasmid maintenance system k
MIVSFADQETEELFFDKRPKKLPNDILRVARRKLLMLHAARTLNDLRIPPANRLEKLRDDRKGQYSIRINDQWRICFRFENGLASEVEITDYH